MLIEVFSIVQFNFLLKFLPVEKYNLAKIRSTKKKGHVFGAISNNWFKMRSQSCSFYNLIHGSLWLFVATQNLLHFPNAWLFVFIRGYLFHN